MTETTRETTSEDLSSRKVAGVGWGVLLVWIGIVLFLRWGWGLGLVGAGVIVLAAQVWRRRLGLALEGSGLVFGVLLLACGLWTLLALTADVVPVLCVAAGIALLVSTLTGRRPHGPPTDVHAHSHPH